MRPMNQLHLALQPLVEVRVEQGRGNLNHISCGTSSSTHTSPRRLHPEPLGRSLSRSSSELSWMVSRISFLIKVDTQVDVYFPPTESLFSPTSTPSRKFWGFEIFSKTLPLLPKTELPLVFTQNFMRVWMSQLSGQDRLLHKAALRVVSLIAGVLGNLKIH